MLVMLVRCLRSASLALLAHTACSASTEYACEADAQCVDAGIAGVCQSPGWCSFPDAGCESGQRYGDLAGGGLAGTCVPVDGGSSGVAEDATATMAATTPTTDETTNETATDASATLSTTTPLTTGVDVTGDVDTTSVSPTVSSTTDESATEPGSTDDSSTGPSTECPTYVDDFEDGVIGAEWDVYLPESIGEVDGALVFVVSADGRDEYPWTGLLEPQDFTQGWARARVGSAPASYPEQLFLAVSPVAAPQDAFIFFLEDVYLFARFDDPAEGWIDIYDTTFDPDIHRWLQIRGEDTTLYFEAAGEDEMFETLAFYDTGYVLDDMVVALQAGNYDPIAADSELSFEHFEVCSP
jgi:hypothetical protein